MSQQKKRFPSWVFFVSIFLSSLILQCHPGLSPSPENVSEDGQQGKESILFEERKNDEKIGLNDSISEYLSNERESTFVEDPLEVVQEDASFSEEKGPEISSPDEISQESAPSEPINESISPEVSPEPMLEGCGAGLTLCGTTCVRTEEDAGHCGACGKACKATEGCFQGKCLTTSTLWGRAGEKFDPKGRLMDWSYAGYGHGEVALPTRKPTVQLTAYGAVADDGKDDTAAFEQALSAVAKGGVIGIPKGTFVLSKRLSVPSGVVIQGQGPNNTIISIPKSLTDLYGNTGLSQGGTSSYSFGGAFFEVRGSSPTQAKYLLATVTTQAKRGEFKLEVNDAQKLKVGQWVLFAQTDNNRTLMNHLHAGLMTAGDDNVGDMWTSPNRIASINNKMITFERAFPVDIQQQWKPTLYSLDALATQSGVEGMTIRFPATTYPGHFKEQGFNAIHFARAYLCWVRNVRIENADYGVNLGQNYNTTVQDVTLESVRPQSSLHGHHGLNVSHGADNLLIGFAINTTFVHDLTVEWYSTGNVFTKGSGKNLRMDHHRAAPYLTLWTELDLGQGTSAFVSGGRSDRGPNSAAYSTFWNFVAKGNVSLPPNNYGPRLNFIGFPTTQTTSPSSYDWWLEVISAQRLGPPNLWEAMRLRRLGKP